MAEENRATATLAKPDADGADYIGHKLVMGRPGSRGWCWMMWNIAADLIRLRKPTVSRGRRYTITAFDAENSTVTIR